MKKILSMMLVLLMLAGAACAQQLIPGESVQIDLDGDGAAETVLVKEEGFEEDRMIGLYVTGSDGGMNIFQEYLMRATTLCVEDLDGNGVQEILISGDICSADYYTWCLNYSLQDGLVAVLFADAERGENTGEYDVKGYGGIDVIEGSTIKMTGTQDVLGTWAGSRVFTLQDGRFELLDGGMWIIENDMDDPEIWDYRALIPVADIPVTLEDGSEGVISAGEKFLITMSDKTSIVYFETAGGLRGSFPIEPDTETGWGCLVNGMPEEACFEYVPYAD